MTMRGLQLYKCQVCDSVVEVLDSCGVELVCCGPPMMLLPEQAAPAGRDEHAVTIRRQGGGVHVAVGRPPHPTEGDDRIAWIELLAEGLRLRRFLDPGRPPEATFEASSRDLTVRYYCTSHGLWTWPGSSANAAAGECSRQLAGSAS